MAPASEGGRRPLARIGGGDLPTVEVDPKNENVVYSRLDRDVAERGRRRKLVAPCAARQAATITRRSGSTRTIRRFCSSSPIRAASSQPIAARRGATGTRSRRRRCITSPQTRVSVSRLRRPAGLGVGVRRRAARWTARSRSTTGIRSTFRSTASPRPIRKIRTWCTAARARTCRSTTGAPVRRRTSDPAPSSVPDGFGRNVRTMPIEWSPVDQAMLFYASNVVWKSDRPCAQLDAHQPRSHAADVGRSGDRRQVCEHRDAGAARRDHGALAVPARHQRGLGGHATTAPSR